MRNDIIKNEHGKFVLYSHSGKKLGEHATEASARAQESAINIAKARAAGHKIPKPDADEECDWEIDVADDKVTVKDKAGAVIGSYDMSSEKEHMPHADADGRRVLRYDTGELERPVKLPNGWMKCDAFLTRTGVFKYRNPDGSERRELRLSADVFDPTSVESFKQVPVTDEHPPVFLTATNTKNYARGSVGDAISRVGDKMRGQMLITDADLIAKLESGKARQVSNGYTCELEEVPGVFDGVAYDAVQKNIRGNHVAIVPLGRAGDAVRVRMDSSASAMLSICTDGGSHPRQERANVKKITIDGVEYEEGSAQAAAAMTAWKAKLDAEEKTRKADADKAIADAKTATAEREKEKARADGEAERARKLDADLKAAPGKVAAELKARMALEADARKVLGKKAKLDGLDDKALKLEVLKKLDPEFEPKGKSAEYIDARYDFALEHADDADGNEPESVLTDPDERGDETDEAEPGDPAAEMSLDDAEKKHTDSRTAYEAMCVRHRFEWQKPIAPSSRQLTDRE